MSDTTLKIVLGDGNMPGIGGLEFGYAVRANPHYQTLPLMMVTTVTERSQMGKALAQVQKICHETFYERSIQKKIKNFGNWIS